jgi:hypothetical protein
MAVQSLFESGAHLRFTYWRKREDGGLEKLAVGEHDFTWVKRAPTGQAVPQPLPEAVREALERHLREAAG